ncbi:hypothetical protein KCP75_11205 [Salmonella enterica subsp. enterica]|nr:hypothetical protein KCP75_11205 [Salmonella enterica subsp. enterica]
MLLKSRDLRYRGGGRRHPAISARYARQATRRYDTGRGVLATRCCAMHIRTKAARGLATLTCARYARFAPSWITEEGAFETPRR